MSSPRRPSQPVVVAIVYVAAMFVTILDTTIVHVTLPTLADEFGVGIGSIEWVVTGYLLSLAVWIPASGWIGDRIGTKRTLLFAIAVFTVASALCGMSTSLGQLVAFRILQGVGGGMLAPVGLAMLFRAFPPERRAQASKVLIIPTAVAPALGPIVGGALIESASWHWVFLVNVPIGIAVFVFGAVYLHEHREPAAGRFDVPGFLLAGGALALILFAMSEGPKSGWGAPITVATGVAGLAAAVALVLVELRTAQPMLTLPLLRNRLFRSTNAVSVFATAAFMGTLFLLPVMLQQVRDATALESGLTTFPEALGVLAVSQLVGRLYSRVGPRALMVFGMAAMGVLLVAVSRVGLETSEWTIRGLMFALGGSFAFLIIALQASSFATIAPADTGRASALYNTQRQVSQALGVAVVASTLAAFLASGADGSSASDLGAYQKAFLVTAVIAFVGSIVAIRVPDADAHATRVARHRAPAAAD